MSQQKNKYIQIRCSGQFKKEVKNYCDKKDVDLSEYIRGLIKKDIDIREQRKPLKYGVDWEL